MQKYQLKTPLRYGDKSYTFIELAEPTTLHCPLIAKIKQAYNMACVDMTKRLKEAALLNSDDSGAQPPGAPTPIDTESHAQAIRSVLDGACSGTDAIYEHMRALLLSRGIARLEDAALSVGYLDKLSLNDFIGLTAYYMATFILPAS